MNYKRGYVFPQDKLDEDESSDSYLTSIIAEIKRVYKITTLSDKYYKIHMNGECYVIGIKNNVLHGLLKVFSLDGDLKSITQYINGIKHGMYIKYHDNGKTATVGSFVNGDAKGNWSFYNDKGQITNEIKY